MGGVSSFSRRDTFTDTYLTTVVSFTTSVPKPYELRKFTGFYIDVQLVTSATYKRNFIITLLSECTTVFCRFPSFRCSCLHFNVLGFTTRATFGHLLGQSFVGVRVFILVGVLLTMFRVNNVVGPSGFATVSQYKVWFTSMFGRLNLTTTFLTRFTRNNFVEVLSLFGLTYKSFVGNFLMEHTRLTRRGRFIVFDWSSCHGTTIIHRGFTLYGDTIRRLGNVFIRNSGSTIRGSI